MKARHVKKIKKALIAAFFLFIAAIMVFWTMAPLFY